MAGRPPVATEEPRLSGLLRSQAARLESRADFDVLSESLRRARILELRRKSRRSDAPAAAAAAATAAPRWAEAAMPDPGRAAAWVGSSAYDIARARHRKTASPSPAAQSSSSPSPAPSPSASPAPTSVSAMVARALDEGERRQREKDRAAGSAAAAPPSSSSSSLRVDDVAEVCDEAWVADRCKEMCKSIPTSLAELSKSLITTLVTSRSNDDIQSELFDLLGFESFDLITLLITKRAAIKEWNQNKGKGGKKRRKEAKAPKIIKEESYDSAWKTEEEVRESAAPKKADPALLFALPASTSGPGRASLPEGTRRVTKETYEEVSVPPPVLPPPPSKDELVPVASLDRWAQSAFEGYTHLNRIQSRIFEAAYRTNANLLVCAPTGAGKTNIALLAILHEIGNHVSGGPLRRGDSDFKIVYVAPMKALAQEVTRNFQRRLHALGVVVKELTGDMQLTKREIADTHIIVTTPEKWDVVTRKSNDSSLAQLVKLIIIDEIHLLHEDRGPVLEILVARTLRQVEKTQSMIRIIGLSATLPNYQDIGEFLHADKNTGVFYFDSTYRPVPLSMKFIGLRESNPLRAKNAMNDVCYEKVVDSLRRGYQVMVFVHSRKETVSTARRIVELAQHANGIELLQTSQDKVVNPQFAREVSRSRNREIQELFPNGLSCHHAGMLRPDRTLVERLFAAGAVKVLVCTATLAWGVNLPAHTVIIKGTQLYNPEKGGFVDLGMLDVMQIFGRAGRPQFDKSGEGIIITTNDKLSHYLALLCHQLPIESQFISRLPDHLNAEIVLGTVTNIKEAISWLSYTYLYIRMKKNPLVYGVPWEEVSMDADLIQRRRSLITSTAKRLDRAKMIRFDQDSGVLAVANLGRVASHYYIQHESMDVFGESISEHMSEADILDVVCQSNEFENLRMRPEEQQELDKLKRGCVLPVKGQDGETRSKVNILFQAFLSRYLLENFTLIMDSNYITQNMSRILRGLFEMVLHKGWCTAAMRLLTLCKLWHKNHPLAQFVYISPDLIRRLEQHHVSVDALVDMTPSEIGSIINLPRMGGNVLKAARQFPYLEVSATIQPITRSVLRVHLTIDPQFEWSDRVHGAAEPWWIWVEDTDNEHLYHSEYFVLTKKKYEQRAESPIVLVFTIPIFEPLPSQYYVRVVSDRWLGAENAVPLSFAHLVLPQQYPPHTALLDLVPLPVTALHNEKFQSVFKFAHFNPVQTQVFHVCYHTDHSVLLGAPTGSGKTVAAELAMLKVFRDTPHLKVVYIAPLKALVRERMSDWGERFARRLGKSLVELTGDYTPNVRALQSADIVTTTPEKWDGVSRSWKSRDYVKSVALVIIDEIHMLGEERGPVLEVIVSRMRYISAQTDRPIRIIGLSTAVANAQDIVSWLGVKPQGLFNFRPAVRPVPLEVHIEGHAGKHYCPRMQAMNKPTYQAICVHSPTQPVLVFVSSRRQTRLTALDLIAIASVDEQPPQRWLHMSEAEAEMHASKVRDASLRQVLPFGIGMHHAGLCDDDRRLVEELFRQNKIQILVTTATLAWGVNLPAHLVVIKGSEFYDPKTRKYVDFPVTDMLQMMGRAGRPQYDTSGKAVILVEESKKNFYHKFLYEPFPVESCLLSVLPDHFNAEVCGGAIRNMQDAVDYLTWTYFYRRLVKNPSYYGADGDSDDSVSVFLSGIVGDAVTELSNAGCIEVDGVDIVPTTLGKIASYYYLKHETVSLFNAAIKEDSDVEELLNILSDSAEYDGLPVRHNEDLLNAQLAEQARMPVDDRAMEDPHTKAVLLLQAHFSSLPLPISDYITDTKSVLDQSIRILQAMIDLAADRGWLWTCLNTMQLMEMVVQARWLDDSTLLTMPFVEERMLPWFRTAIKVETLPELFEHAEDELRAKLATQMPPHHVSAFVSALQQLPSVDVGYKVTEANDEVNVRVTLTRKGPRSRSGFAYAPKYPKPKQDGWWVVVGSPATGELHALRRVGIMSGNTCSTTLSFAVPDLPASRACTLYVMSDTYLGLNQQYDIRK
eukprot:m51a1_g1579 putative activating signal cointegrator 1 complex subunit 3 (2006) ;mRNA; r:104604-111515